jgi:hypothetical protein
MALKVAQNVAFPRQNGPQTAEIRNIEGIYAALLACAERYAEQAPMQSEGTWLARLRLGETVAMPGSQVLDALDRVGHSARTWAVWRVPGAWHQISADDTVRTTL